MPTIEAARPGRVLAALMTPVLVLAGCAAGPSGGPSAMTIQFVNPLPNYPTWRRIGDCMGEEATRLGVDLTQSGPTGQALDTTAMIQQVRQATATKKDAVITFPAGEGFAPVLKQAQAAGVVTGTVYGPGGEDSGSDFNIGPEWAEIGGTLVGAVAALPGDHVLGLVAAADTGLGK
ncbi:MAG TPA: substrate-binding domain-containing protein, partial [Umezawaea sp.]|nr:substrate-binding domain-containing protein [Umezawaea sp.]